MHHCSKKECLFLGLTKLMNIGLILMCIFVYSQTYGDQKYLILLLGLPPLFSLIALQKRGDKEERSLKTRIRKAELRKQLKDLEEFDKADS